MSDYSNRGYNYHSKIVDLKNETYLVQGRIDDPLTMFRPVEQVLECEKDEVQKMPYFKDMLEGERQDE